MTTNNERADRAELMPAFGPDTEIREGAESRALLADLLADPPVGGEEEVTRRLKRGRPSLNGPSHTGRRARSINMRISDTDYTRIGVAVKRAGLKHNSDLVRTALDEYFTNHKISA